VAVRLKELLRSAGIEVLLTKQSENEFVANRRRALIANRANADLFLRLHCDSGEGTGFAVYYPDRQGRAHGRVGPSPAVINASRTAASRFHDALALALAGKLKDNGLLGDSKTFVGRQQGALTGSVFSEVPALTIEMCVLDNRADAAFISAREGREQMARALLAACVATVR
jgi:N-acetylmuramoyl-L-alanine amidase